MNLAQPDFNLAALPTNLRLPKGKFAFRITHRFARPLGEGDFGDLRRRLLRIRLGRADRSRAALRPVPGRAGRHQPDLGSHHPVLQPVRTSRASNRSRSASGRGAASTAPTTSATATRRRSAWSCRASSGRYGAVYAEPIWVNNTNPEPSELVDDNSTFMIGLGTRLRLRPTVYVTAEVSPRVAGYAPGETLVSFGVEKRVGGHAFSLNFSNGFGTTMAPGRARRDVVRRLVHRLQHLAQVLLSWTVIWSRDRGEMVMTPTRCRWVMGMGVAAIAGGGRGVRRRIVDSPTSPTRLGRRSSGGGTVSDAATITISSAGVVSPSTVTIRQGGRVTFVNNDSRAHDMASDPHPTHEDCPPIDQVGFLSHRPVAHHRQPQHRPHLRLPRSQPARAAPACRAASRSCLSSRRRPCRPCGPAGRP